MMSGEDYKRKLVGMFVDGTPLRGVELAYLYDCGITCNEGLDRGIILTEYGRSYLSAGPDSDSSQCPDVDAEPTSAKDTQVAGDHYKKLGVYQPWEVLAHWMSPEELRGYMKGTVIAYLAREQDKGGDTDIAKALHTMQLWEELRKDK